MSHRSQETAFAEFVVASRPLLLGAACLMFGTARRAEDVVRWSLAQRYRARTAGGAELSTALRVVLFSEPGRLPLSPAHGQRFELIDGSAGQDPPPPAVVTDLARLPEDQRRVLILQRFAELPTAQLATVLGTTEVAVHALAREARAGLVARDPARVSDPYLTEQLRAAVPPHLNQPADPIDDLVYGRQLVRRRAVRTSLVVVAALVAAVLGGVQLAPMLGSGRQSTQGPVTAPTASTRSSVCDPSQATCQNTLVRDWRARMAQVTSSYLDPQRSYFSGYGYAYNDRYDSDDFWRGGGGVLGLDMFRVNAGATQVYIQIATSSSFALRCGRQTRQTCQSTKFMDGNRYTLTDTYYASEGLEVQYSPNGDEVITVVARNISKGKALEITRPQLVALVQDPRLRLPQG